MHEDTIATYEDGGRTYEIDHLGISRPENRAVAGRYVSDEEVAEYLTRMSVIARHLPSKN